MDRRVSWVRSWSSVSRSGSSMSSSRIATVVAPARSSACTPALPIVRPALVHWSRVKAMYGASRSAAVQSAMSASLSNATRYVVLNLTRSQRALNSSP